MSEEKEKKKMGFLEFYNTIDRIVDRHITETTVPAIRAKCRLISLIFGIVIGAVLLFTASYMW